MDNFIADLIDLRLHPFLIQSRQLHARMRECWSRRQYSDLLIEVEAAEAACNNFAAELRSAIKADESDTITNLYPEDDV